MDSMIQIYSQGFERGYSQIRVGDLKKARAEIYKALGINNRTTFAKYLHGEREPKASAAVAVELVFRSYGITEIWGHAEGKGSKGAGK